MLDFSNVTRVGGAARILFRGVPEAAGTGPSGRPRVLVRDPAGVLRDEVDGA